MLNDPFFRDVSLLGDERCFAHPLVLRVEAIAVGVVSRIKPALGRRIVAAAEFHAEIATDEDWFAEH